MAFFRTHTLHVLTASAALVLTACGGGGSSTTTATTTNPATTTAATTTTATTTATTTTPTTATSSTTTSTNECTPLVPKAGDSLTYTTSNPVVARTITSGYDYTNGTYMSQPVTVLTINTTLSDQTTSSVSYLNPITGAVISNGTSATNTITTYDPVDYESRLRAAVTTVGQKATVGVKARISGLGISSRLSAIGGGTALNITYTYSIERLPNETVTVSGKNYSTCKLKFNAIVSNFSLEGANTSNPLYATVYNAFSSTFGEPIDSTVWISNQIPNVVKTTGSITSGDLTATGTQILTAAKLAGR